jgi:hypothetical protein
VESPRADPIGEVGANFPVSGHVCTIYPCTGLK